MTPESPHPGDSHPVTDWYSEDFDDRSQSTSEALVRPPWGVIALRALGTVAAVGVVTAGLLWNTLFAQMPSMPSREDFWTLNREPAVEFLDSTGATIAVRGPNYGRGVSAASLPDHVVQAFLAAEDQHFHQHSGIDLKATLRAALQNARVGSTVQGGSTITQQLAKNLFLTGEQTIKRKVQEARLAAGLEQILAKDEILDLYLNRIYLGDGAYGLDAAAHTYFGKPASGLTLAEAAMLASFPKAPSRFANSLGEPEAIERQHYVLRQMVEAGFITAEQSAAAKAEHLMFIEPPSDRFSGHALDYAMDQVHQVLPDAPSDLVVKLTLDLSLQQAAQEAVERGIATMGSEKRASEAAAILIDINGGIRALVGGRDYAKSQFNRATQARRQPGSAFKMFVYAAALEQGMKPWTTRYDAPMRIGKWKPKNYGGEYFGEVTLTTALVLSLNTVAAQVGYQVGPKNVAALARRFGVRSQLQNHPSIALGADEVTLLDLVTGYGVLAKGGERISPFIIEEIRNSKGDLLYSNPVHEGVRVYSQSLAEDMTYMLNRVVTQGTARAARVAGWDVAGKTGTSQGWRDAWFIGYTTRFVGGVWAGNDNDRSMPEVTGGSLPARIFSEMMTEATKGLPPERLPGVKIEEPLPDEPVFELDDPLAFSLDTPAELAKVDAIGAPEPGQLQSSVELQ